MKTRREFLESLCMGGLVAAAHSPGNAGGRNVQIGCQTNAWAVDPKNFESLLGVLGTLKTLRYDGFETGFRNLQGQFGDAPAARKRLAGTGLRFFATHIFLEQYDPVTRIAPMELVRSVVEGASALGAERLILSGAGLVRDGRLDMGALKRKAGGLNEAGAFCRSRGMALAYHNHGPEFAEGGLEIEALYQETDPRLVGFVTDCGWAFRGGADVPAFFARHHRRMAGMHLRDFKGDAQVPLGQGDFPLAELAAEIRKTNWTGWVLNEEERLSGEKPGETAVAPARAALRKTFRK